MQEGRDTIKTLTQSLKNINVLLEKNSTKVLPDNLIRLLKDVEKTLKAYENLAKTYSKESMFKEKLDVLLKDIDSSVIEAKKFLKKIDKRPNRLIFGD
jgi:paraquat-inducible protein B